MKAAIDFARQLLRWSAQHGRHDLPWQRYMTPYRIWVSEIMLQQTQVKTVIPYYDRFITRFPDVKSLAAAELDEVLHLWTGLGYYARARNLHRAAQQIMEQYGGKLPGDIDRLMALPGIGRSTAGAILALADGQRYPILDGNVKRVLTRYHAIPGWPGTAKVERHLWQLAEAYTPQENVARYTQAIMDLGATICLRRNPLCDQCPLGAGCQARQRSVQHIFPQSKPGKTLPVRTTVFAILQNHRGEVLLEHRQPAGIWGGLWVFPECAPNDDIQSWIETRLGYAVNTLEYGSRIRHTFSHFHLDIIPVHAKITVNKHHVNDADRYCWYTPAGGRPLGMATPVKRLLNEVILNPMDQQ